MTGRVSGRITCAGMAVLLAVCAPCAAYAASPDFAHTAEEWATLRDNKMEYGELAGLVHEYNPTVQQNGYDYSQFRKDYGETKDDVSQNYRRLADELLNDISYPDADDANYAAGMAAALSSETQAKNMQSAADTNLEDAETKNLTYEMAEQSLVQTAQNNMIAYHTGLLDIRKCELTRDLNAVLLDAAGARAAAGTGTQVEVLTAQQNKLTAEQALIKAQSDQDTGKRKLQVMLGWKADAEPEIGDIPETDVTRIDRMNPETDREKALANNYTLRINKKKLQNYNSETQKNTMTSTIADNESKIAVSLTNAYRNAVNARNSYDALTAEAQLKNVQFGQTAQKYAIGSASRVDYDQAQIENELAQIAAEEARYSLFEAMEAYDWNVGGLANAS